MSGETQKLLNYYNDLYGAPDKEGKKPNMSVDFELMQPAAAAQIIV